LTRFCSCFIKICASLRSAQDAEIASLRENVSTRVEEVASTVQQSVENERQQVQQVLDTVKSAMRKQNEQNQQCMQTLHSSQQRLVSQIAENAQSSTEKLRFLEQNVAKLDSSLNLKTQEMSRGLSDHVSSIKRHLDANDQAVRLVTDMMHPTRTRTLD